MSERELSPKEKELKALDQIRLQLSNLTNSLASLQASVAQSDPLPPWESFQTQANIVSRQMERISDLMAVNKQLLDHAAVFPFPEFPGRTQEGLLGQLLRKKLEPSVEEWVAEAVEQGKAQQPLIDVAEQDQLGDFATEIVEFVSKRRRWGANYTLEEHELGIENVTTGLKRRLSDNALPDPEPDAESEEGESPSNGSAGEEEGDDNEREVVDIHRKPSGVGIEIDVRKDIEGKVASLQQKPPMPLAEQLRFLTTGALPRSEQIPT